MQRLSFWHQLHQSFQHQQWGLGSNICILGRHKHAIHNRRITFFTFPVKPASLPLSWWSHVSFVRARILGLILSSLITNPSHHFSFLHGSQVFPFLPLGLALSVSCLGTCHYPATGFLIPVSTAPLAPVITVLTDVEINEDCAGICSLLWYGGLVPKLCPTLATPQIVACQTPLSMGFSRQEYWSGLQWPTPGYLPSPGIKPRSPALQADSLLIELRYRGAYQTGKGRGTTFKRMT